MKLTTQKLKKLIQEELSEMMEPSEHDAYGTEQDYAKHGISAFKFKDSMLGLQVDLNLKSIKVFEMNPLNGVPTYMFSVPLMEDSAPPAE